MKRGMQLILLFGIVSLFADFTYEGARSIVGPYLSQLGASGFTVGWVTGAGAFAAYGLRLFSGILSDRTGWHWALTFFGYIVNLGAVPLLALTDRWETAAVLVIAERFGKAIRTPPRDALLSYATKETGRGWGFAIHEALDQTGALLGPLLVLGIQLLHGTYPLIFALLSIPAILSLLFLIIARIQHPEPREMEKSFVQKDGKAFPAVFWFYVAAVSFVALGFVDYPLLAFHMVREMPSFWIPLLYAFAMFVDGASALILGRLFDRYGIAVVIGATFLSSFFAPFVVSSGLWMPIIGILLWGIGLGSQDSILRAAVANWIAPERRATAYGWLNLSLGIFWLIGGGVFGYLLDHSLMGAALFSLIAQFLSLPLFFLVRRYETAN